MAGVQRYKKTKSIVVLALTAGALEHFTDEWLKYADYKLPTVNLKVINIQEDTFDIAADMQHLAEARLDNINLELNHYVIQLNWGSNKTGMLMVLLDVFAKNIDERNKEVEQYLLEHLPGFNGGKVFMQGLDKVPIPKAGWVNFRQVVIPEGFSKYASKIEFY